MNPRPSLRISLRGIRPDCGAGAARKAVCTGISVHEALRIGGLLFIQTHQSIPIHNYPADYFRFTREGLAGLFGTKMGFTVLATDYEYPVRTFSLRDRQSQLFPAYLNVRLTGEKTGKTPSEYIYELDTI